MKKYLYILTIALGAIFAASCSNDLLVLDNPNALTKDTAFNSEGDIDLTLTGVYHSFYSSYYAMMSSNQFSGQSDECLTYSTTDLINYIMLHYENYSWNWNNCTWNQLYQQVFRCNQVIQFAEENVTEWKEFSKDQIVGQAKAIRAYAYYQLAMLYGKVPYVDYVTEAGDEPAEQTFDQLCQHIIDDAEFAYKVLPASYFKNYDGKYPNQYRVTKWFAACVLGKTYMNWNKQYAKALPYYKDIVENGGFSLAADFNDNFKITTENNSESIWEIQNFANTAGAGGAYYGRNNNGATPDYGMWRWKFYGLSPLGWGDYDAERWLLWAFKNEVTVADTPTTTAGMYDPRLEATLLYPDIFKDFPAHDQWGYKDYNLWKDRGTRVMINKYVAQYENGVQVNSDNCEGTNNRIFRLGEIKLDYAECLAQTGDLTGAIKQIDDVRQRAGLAKLADREPVTSVYVNTDNDSSNDMNLDYGYAAIKAGNITLDAVMSVIDIEDAKETSFECERFVDIRRWGIGEMGAYYQKVANRSDKFKKDFQAYKIWLPIPIAEVDNNSNLNQNEGY
ncbi:MAG: RagB/SusD family nutrient uptake outer membrane protein [Bacteroidales bacterium]|nr:RagB/SusD family nutrient uptake outer membrane protein [Bacteroidales bacterium]